MLVEISNSTGIATTNLSLIFTFITIGTVVGQLTSVMYNKKFKRIRIVLAGYLLTILTIIIISFTSNLILFYILFFISGYFLGVIWIQANQYILENKVRNKDRIVTILFIFFPVGGLVSPSISSMIIRADLGWRFAYYVIIFLIVLNMILYVLLLGRRKEQVIDASAAKVGFKEIFTDRTKNLVFSLIVLALVFYCASETVIATWAPTFYRLTANMDIQSTSYVLTLFWLFMFIGRLIILFIAGRVKAIRIMLVISVIAVISMTVAVFMRREILIYISIAAAGLGCSAMYPLLISTGSTVYDRGKGILATILFISANIGIAGAPFLIKFISSANMLLSISFSFILMIITSLALISMQLVVSRKKIS